MIVSKNRKRPHLRTRVVNRIADISVDDWNRVFPDVLGGYGLSKALDESDIKQFAFYYIMVYDRKVPVGAAQCFLMDYSLDTSIGGPLKRVTIAVKKLIPNVFSLKTLICGTPLTPGVIGIKGEAGAIMNAILLRMEQIAKKKKARIIAFKDFDANYTQMLDPLRQRGFVKIDGLPMAEMNVRFKDFEEYITTLSSENRYGLRRKLKKKHDHSGISMEVSDSIEGNELKEVYELYLEVQAKHGMNFEVMPPDFFKNVSVNMPGRSKFFLWRIDGRLVMFLFCLISKDMFSDCQVGFDYSVAHKYNLYFVQFRDTMSWCIENGVKRYEMGVSGYEAKRRLGFDFMPHYLYAKFRNRMLRPAFNLICRFLKFENFDPALKIVKNRKSGG